MSWLNHSSKTPIFMASGGGMAARAVALRTLVLTACLSATPVLAQNAFESPVPERAQPIRTAPEATAHGMPGAEVEVLSRRGTAQHKFENTPTSLEKEAPWVLSPEQQPWPLHYREPAPMNVLHLNIPSLAEARLMLPGRAADMLERAQASIHKYINDAIGHSAQFRGAQLESLDTWIERTLMQLRDIPEHPWAQYQFNKSARKIMQDYRDRAEPQSGRALEQVYGDIQHAVSRISPIIEVMPTHELSMGWYNAMVQLRNGLDIYQSQVHQADQRVLSKIDDFLNHHPAVAQPAGDPPPQPRSGLSGLSAIEKAQQQPMAPKLLLDAPSSPAPEDRVELQASGDSTGGLIVLAGMLGVAIYFVMRLRKAGRRKVGIPE